MGASFETGQGPVVSLIELKNGELVSGGDDGCLRRWQDVQAVNGEACKELQEHPVLLSPKTHPNRQPEKRASTMGS